ncbi:L,D-transpeptidase [Rhodopseudomonas sp. HC1]|uniref:L,D-transpeptidase n=1 Tax=Rhodopseudomonas infernalis TaxID=2897386 RepID=UPI001EE8788E|nr:L,D-transpeptidase [Rhodopseudomonas infernalis]MCG6205062.1 L,D-transpeptidase [Rhodopseudomonas infernalis]
MINTRISSRCKSMTRPLLAIAAALLLTTALPGAASAQMMGYAAAPQTGPFGADDEVLATPPAAQLDASGSDEDSQLSDRLRRQVVRYDSNEPAGTIVIDTANTYLYYVIGGGRAIRYGVGVGREGFTWAGTQTITRKAEWPDWHPPAQMIARQPYLPRFMAGGPGNPLGARAMYLGSTEYRIHGTNDPSTIGKFVSSGCIRLTNEDVEDLFSRTRIGSRVVVLPKSSPNLEARSSRTQRQAMNLSVSSVD